MPYKDPQKAAEQKKRYYEENKEKVKEYKRKWAESNKDSIKERTKRWHEQNKDHVKKQRNEYRLANKDKIYKRMKKYRSSVKGKLDHTISTAICKHLKANKVIKANKHWEDIVGYTADDLIVHLESRFTPDMNWDNYGTYWHVDHIKPKSWFLYESMEDPVFKECWALSNLQPLEAVANMKKNNLFEG